MAVQIKSVREDEYSRTITLHYLNDGDIYLRLLMSKKEL
jgi:DNA-directed RNA polymerase I subunit RPA2